MNLNLNAHSTIRDAKKQFSRYFPFLKLEFFTIPHQPGSGSAAVKKLSDRSFLIDITGVLKEGVFHFDQSITVAQFEQKLQEEYGIPVQVFRKSGAVWIETIQTDHLSLEAQNLMGKESMSPVRFNVNTLFL